MRLSMNRGREPSLVKMMLLIVLCVQLLSLLGQPLLATEVYDYADSNTSDVDALADEGTHSNFTAQQYGPDSLYDTLTETRTVAYGGSGEGMAIWFRGNNFMDNTWNGTVFGATNSTNVGYRARILAGAAAPTRNEKIVVAICDDHNIRGRMWNGSTWSALPSPPGDPLGAVSETYWWGADVAYEQSSGDAMLVWNDNPDLKYSVWNGSTWTTSTTIDGYTGTEPQHMHISAKSLSDEMLLVVNDDSADDYVLVWDGSSWGNATLLDSSGDGESDQSAIFVDYEQQSGRGVVVYGNRNDEDCYYRIWNGSGWSIENAVPAPGGVVSQVQWITTASDPRSNRIALGVLTEGGASADIWLCVWNGSAWESAELATTGATGSIYPNVAVAFESRSGEALAVYGRTGLTSLSHRYWSSGVGWSGGQVGLDLGSVPNSMMLDANPDPNSDEIMLSVQDFDSDLNYMLWEESSWTTTQELETDTQEDKNQPFIFLWQPKANPSYGLDLEAQWTEAEYSQPYEELCIYGGVMGSENLRVDVWNGSTWNNLFTDLSSGWNNASVSSYLTSSTFTIRFKGGEEAGDDNRDSWEIDCTLLHVWAVLPVPIFSFTPNSPYTGETVIFNASNSYDPDGTIISYLWDFGDQTNATGEIVAHAYPDNGNYTVTLTVTDDDSTSASSNTTITVLNRPPTANFTESAETAYTDEPVTFNASNSYDPDGTIISYLWDFGDQTNATGEIVAHAYPDNGNYTVTLTVTDDDGAQTIVTGVETILNRSPVASFQFSPQQPTIDDYVVFNATASLDPDGTIVTYVWDFDDGNITTTSSSVVTHRYLDPGDFNVTLTVTDNDGHNASTLQTIAVTVQSVAVHDVGILSANLSHTEADVGQVINITVTVENKGTETEAFSVVVYYNETLIGSQAVADLTSDSERTLIFHWNTTGLVADVYYEIRAEASSVPGEVSIIDNAYICGTVRVKSPDPVPFDWGPVVPYVTTIGGVVVAVVSAIVYQKELLALILSLLGALGIGGLKGRKRRRDYRYFGDMTGGGIPGSFSVMISGGPGSGKSVLCQKLTQTFLADGKTCVYVSYDCFPDEIRRSMEKLGWSVSKYEDVGKLLFVDSFSSIARVTSKESYSVAQPFSLSDLSITLSAALSEQEGASVVFLDSVVPILTNVAPSKVAEFLQDRSARIKGAGGTFLFTVSKETMDKSLTARLEEIVDCVIELEVSEGKTVRRMRVKKMRGREISSKWVQFELDTKKGITFLV